MLLLLLLLPRVYRCNRAFLPSCLVNWTKSAVLCVYIYRKERGGACANDATLACVMHACSLAVWNSSLVGESKRERDGMVYSGVYGGVIRRTTWLMGKCDRGEWNFNCTVVEDFFEMELMVSWDEFFRDSF